MARLDRKKGRFSVDYETNEIESALTGWSRESGDFVQYYRFNPGASVMNDVLRRGGRRREGLLSTDPAAGPARHS